MNKSNFQKGYVVPLVIVVVVILIVGGVYMVTKNQKKSVEVAVQDDRTIREQSIISNLVTNWKSIAPSIIPGYPKASVAFYGYPYEIAFKESYAVVVRYVNSNNEFVSYLSLSDGSKFIHIQTQMLTSDYKAGVETFGSVSSVYEFSSTREGELVYPSDWVKVKDNSVIVKSTKVRLISPNGGETYNIGDNIEIKWWDDNDAGNRDIDVIDLSHAGPQTYYSIRKNVFMRSSGVDGNYTNIWKISEVPAGKEFKIVVCKSETQECDSSDDVFTITN